MDQKVGLTAGIVALLALVAHVAVPAGSAGGAGAAEKGGGASKKVQTGAAGGTPRSYEGPWLATRRFFAPSVSAVLDPGQPADVDVKDPEAIIRCSGDPNCRPELWSFFGLGGTTGIASMLALVPDPYHTRLALVTDRTIEAIEKGAVAAGWEFAAEWLPWIDTITPDESDPSQTAQARLYLRAQELQPGLLVFRRAAWDPIKRKQSNNWGTDTLLVFVVGETPTTGINPGQFEIARAYMEALRDRSRNPSPVKILGPTFSGSFDSLAVLIKHERANQPELTYQVQSGTAQSSYDARAFKAAVNPRGGTAIVEFHSATEDLWGQASHFVDLLNQLRIPPEQAAVLTEDESAFGDSATAELSNLRTFRFPRDISHLRDAYRQAQQTANPSSAPTPDLDFSLKDPRVGEDAVPTYSPTQTPLSQNGVINEITRAIRRFDIRIVQVSATNVFDLLFLGGLLRRQCPDTRLAILNADLLFVQAEQTQPLGGALFFSSYPLFTETGAWAGQNRTTNFPDTLTQGAFNATVLLLLPDPSQPDPAAQRQKALADYTWHSDNTANTPYPPEWLLMLDRRGFMPVRLWTGETDGTKGWFESVNGTAAQRAFRSLIAPPLWTLISGLFAVLGVVLGIWMIRLRRRPKWQVDARFEPSNSEDSWHGFYLLMFLVVLLGIQLGIFAARWYPDEPLHLVLVAIGFLLPAAVAIGYCRPGKGHRLAACLAPAVMLAGVAVWSFCCLRPGAQGQLFSFRAAELRFGSSPLWPTLAAAAALLLWCFVHVTRLHFASRGQPDTVIDGVEILQGHLQKSSEDFKAFANSAIGILPGHWWGLGIALAGLVAVCAISRVDVQLGSIDGLPYDALTIALPLLVAGLLLLTCWHIHSLWKPLHAFTTNLELLPLASAFVQVSPSGGNRPIWVRRSDLLSLEVHTNSVLVLHDLELHRNELAAQGLNPILVGSWLGLYRDQLAALLRVDPSRTRQTLAKEHHNLWQLSKLIATQICQLTLVQGWRSEPLVRKMAAAAGAQAEQGTAEDSGQALAHQPPSSAPADLDSVLDLGERFVALHYTPFLLYGVRQIKNLFWFPSIGFVLLMFSMNAYNFQAPHWIGTFLLVLFAMITWTLGRCIVQMERDPILSRIAGTNPGQLSAGFYLKIAQYGALPVLGLLAHQFPAISNTLLSGIQPALEALK